MTLKDVARLANVSPSTVSRVLNNVGAVSETVRSRVWAAARELGYTPNRPAQQLKRGLRPDKPGICVGVVTARFATLEADPFFHWLFRSVEERLFACGGRVSRIMNVPDLLRQGPPDADGYVLLGRCPRQALDQLHRLTDNIVGVGRNPTDFDIDEIICSGQQAALLAMEHLVSLGHRQIAYIGSCSYEERFIGYYEALRRHSLPLDQRLVRDTDQTAPAGREAMMQLLAVEGFTAVLCANDATALGALEALSSAGKQLALIGIDNIPGVESVTPALTTVHIPKEEMGRAAVNLLLDRVNGGHREHVRMEFPCRLVVRASCPGPADLR